MTCSVYVSSKVYFIQTFEGNLVFEPFYDLQIKNGASMLISEVNLQKIGHRQKLIHTPCNWLYILQPVYICYLS